VASAVPEIAVGDRLVAVDGVDALALADRFAARVSGSPQWKRWGAPQRMLRARPGTRVTLTVAGPDGRLREVVTTRVRRPEMPAPSRPAPVARLEPGVWYVDLDRAPMVRIRKHLDDLVTAAGVVFDLRGYPANNHEILQHLMTAPERGGDWMQVPRIWRPEFAQVGWRPLSWNLTPAAPRITGRVVFLTDGRAISYAESVMGYVREYALGTIVGGPTAGSNGNVKTLVLPGGSQVSWTGMRVVTHDGEVQHAVGVQPDVRCAPTLAGIRAGRDEVLERGVAIAAGREGGREGGRESPVRQIVDGP
jgi:C-terminal processing protease CtpA/Prc